MKRKDMFIIITLAMITNLISCSQKVINKNPILSKNSSASNNLIASNWAQTWMHDYEETSMDKDGTTIYRPQDSKEKWPPLHYRHKFKFKKDGDCSNWVLADNDGHHWESCKCQIIRDKNALSLCNNQTLYMVNDGSNLYLTNKDPEAN